MSKACSRGIDAGVAVAHFVLPTNTVYTWVDTRRVWLRCCRSLVTTSVGCSVVTSSVGYCVKVSSVGYSAGTALVGYCVEAASVGYSIESS
ncbi:hypothetical protein PC113_g17402 [Phytophthora cactorum]|uniref:Uncharacterized protein n=1 Tax=Phytophthora cactorum TaxID=29920 RepID=A0A8T0YPX6_9STRA|nr:hypothetical protein PC113_g17402 [Phytophthora cactorum]